jgi:phosphoribosylformylglycinamidine synthase
MSNADSNAVHRMLGLTDSELALIIDVLGREPMPLELAMYSVMWSEHCSYKSSRIHLRRLPSEGSDVLVGPGENAGVVDVGDGVAIAVRIESHNHPSAVEPYQGAATGVGGILRDVFTMGARPIALMDPLFFGELDDARSRFIFDGVVRGISGYGNSVGVPTVGGQLTFSRTYRGNPLVNVFCLGLLPIERLVLGRASGVGNLAVLLGSLTGRDGIGGVSVLASAGFSGDEAEEDSKRPSVQVGDPFEEKRLIEASLDLLDQGLVVGIQDLGGAGLSCATSETAARAELGMDVEVSDVPCREPGMTPVEIMTSESQERMLAIVSPSSLDQVLATCAHHEVRATVIGRVTGPDGAGVGRVVVRDGDGVVVADVPAKSLADEAPLYHRPLAPPADFLERQRAGPGAVAAGAGPAGAAGDWPWDLSAQLLSMVYDPAFVFQQYDHQLFLNTVLGPGAADATVLRLAAPGVPFKGKGLALTTDANPGWCAVDPRAGTAATVAEAVLNVACVGGRPVAAVDCLNFGNPEHPVVMWQLSEAIDGMAEACLALGVPVVGGNVSLYNESDGEDIYPTPVVGVVGVIEDLSERPPGIGLTSGSTLVLLGELSSALGGSRWCLDVLRELGGPLAPLDLVAHVDLCELVRSLAAERSHELGVVGIHDVADGGLALCLAEMCAASGVGAATSPGVVTTPAELFSEAPSRVIVASVEPEAVLLAAENAGVPARVLGQGGSDRLVVGGLLDLAVEELVAARSERLPDAAAHAQG